MHRRHVLADSGVSLVGRVGRREATADAGDDDESAATVNEGMESKWRLTTDGGTDSPQLEPFRLTSPAFQDEGAFPRRFSCDGVAVSPPLSIGGVPGGTASLALVVDDPDAPGPKPFVHWLVWNLPANATEVPEDLPGREIVLEGARQGRNDGGKLGYFPACPPKGDDPHGYRFTLYALDEMLPTAPGSRREDLQRAIDGAQVAETQLTATYERAD